MQFTVYKNDLVEALKFVGKFAPVKPLSPILSTVLIEINNGVGMLTLTTNNIMSAAQIKIPASCDDDFAENQRAAVDAKFFQSVVSKCPEDTIKVNADENSFTVKSGSATFELNQFDADPFPEMTRPQEYPIKMRAVTFKKLVRKVAFAVAKNDERPLFTGVNLSITNDGDGASIVAAATNTHRIAIMRERMPATTQDFIGTVPAAALKSVADIIDDKDVENRLQLNVDGKNFFAHINNIFVQTRLLEGEFPDPDRLFEVERNITAEFLRDEFKPAIDLVLLVAKQAEHNTLKLHCDENSITLTADDPERGNVKDFVEATVDGGDVEIGFNGLYLADYLAAVDHNRILAFFKDANTPAMFVESDSPNFAYIITPIRG